VEVYTPGYSRVLYNKLAFFLRGFTQKFALVEGESVVVFYVFCFWSLGNWEWGCPFFTSILFFFDESPFLL
jgi:hypothetical protein